MAHALGDGVAVMTETTTDRVCTALKGREATGLEKYGVTVDVAQLDQDAWLQHLHEEILDAAVYLQRLKDERGKVAEPFVIESDIEALADAWASVDGKIHLFRAGKGMDIQLQPGAHYEGYMDDAASMIRRLATRGYMIVPRPD